MFEAYGSKCGVYISSVSRFNWKKRCWILSAQGLNFRRTQIRKEKIFQNENPVKLWGHITLKLPVTIRGQIFFEI